MSKKCIAKQSLAWASMLLFGTLASGCSSHSTYQSKAIGEIANAESEVFAKNLTIATWNVEHLAYPYDTGCAPRDAESMSKLKQYASRIDADIIGLQEVASEEAVRQLFNEQKWQIVMSARPDSRSYECRGSGAQSTQQKVAFVVKNDIEVLKTIQHDAIGLDNPGLRYGLEILVASDLGNVSILNLHLKSGCFVDDFTQRDSDACKTLGKQVSVLDKWVEGKESQGQPYAILGDLNHRLSAPYNQMVRVLKENTSGVASTLKLATAPVISCHPRYPAPIDHVFVGHLTDTGEPKVWYFDDVREDAMLSDHCAISVSLNHESSPLSQAVKWQTTSKEYEFISRAIYEQAGKSLQTRTMPNTPWVVVMDVDETILDNSQYQVERESKGLGYTPETWDKWVKRQQAPLVPGAKEFIELVLAKGGKLALITNREKSTDPYTWKNFMKVGLPVNFENTCLLGREESDEMSVSRSDIVNDKDLRRLNVTTGSASCYNTGNPQTAWQKPQQILMQVGDNIEDVNDVTQEDADTDALLKRWPEEIVILPNPMYGSW